MELALVGGPVFFFRLVSVCVVYLSDSIGLLCTSTSTPSARSFSLCLVGPLPRRRSSTRRFYDPRSPDASDGASARSSPRDAGYTQVRVDRRARRREALLLDHERRHEAALVAHDAGAQVPVDDEAADARDLLAF